VLRYYNKRNADHGDIAEREILAGKEQNATNNGVSVCHSLWLINTANGSGKSNT
jgi:hypothetical protein